MNAPFFIQPLKFSLAGRFALLLGMVLGFPDHGFAQEALTNGFRHTGTISAAGDRGTWTLVAQANDSLILRVGTIGFTPRLQVFDPADLLVATSNQADSLSRDDTLSMRATNAGVYRVVVEAALADQTGAYTLQAAKIPGTFVVSAGDEGGDLASGVMQVGQLALGDLDLWRFEANGGNPLTVRVGATNFTPWLRLYGPNGVLVAEATDGDALGRDDFLTLVAPRTGTYTLVLSAKYLNQEGSYGVHLARVPATFDVGPEDEGGELPNGVRQVARLPLGDLDLWRFETTVGGSLMLRVGATNFTPWLRLYEPNGALAAQSPSGNSSSRDEFLVLPAGSAGTYTLVVGAKFRGQSGSYGLNLAHLPDSFGVAPDDEGGELTNGVAQVAQLPLGDLDLWRFEAQAGDSLMLRVGTTNFTPWLRLYGPTGALAVQAANGDALMRDDFLTLTALNSGTYTLVVSAKFGGQSGSYGVQLAHLPGIFGVAPDDEGGELPNGVRQPGQLPLGDLDLWRFEALAGDSLMLRVGATNFTPWLRLHDPNGGLAIQAATGDALRRDDSLTLTALNSGTYTLVVSAKFGGQSGAYGLHLAHSPAPFDTAPDDEGGALRNAVTNLATLSLGDLDVWSFAGTPGDSNVFRVTATNFTPWIRLFGPEGTVVKETTTGNPLVTNGLITLVVTNGGSHTLVISAAYAGQSGGYALRQSRVPPDLIMPEQVLIRETETLSVPISAEDPDQTDKLLFFELLSGPPGLTLNGTSATNAILTWATAEADGPGTNQLVAVVTDLVNGTAFRRTNSFIIVVSESNTPPQLSVPGPQTVDELTPLEVAASATDDDLPKNPLTFSLIDPPTGMTIDPQTGVMNWVPDEAQGPGNYTITVVVTDDNPLSVNTTQLSATNTFTVSVREVNRPPQLASPAEPSGDELATLSFQVTASDPDFPANEWTFSLIGAPDGMVIDPVSGLASWSPTEAQGPSTNVVLVRVQDTGVPPLSATNEVVVVVREVNRPPQLASLAEPSGDELATLSFQVTASDPDFPANEWTFSLIGAPDGMVIDPVSGLASWSPTEAQGPSTNVVLVRVQDTGVPPLSATNEVVVVVREVNAAPQLILPGEATVDELTPLTATALASDADLPKNGLTFALVSAPDGLSIDPITGAFSWTPTEVQGPSTNEVVVRVLDQGVPPLATTNTWRVVVREVNLAPVIGPIATQYLASGELLSLTLTVTDEDWPPHDHFVFSLDPGAPLGMTLEAASGVLTWSAPATLGNSTNSVTVRVADNGEPTREASETFSLVVTQPTAPVLTLEIAAPARIRLRLSGKAGQTYLVEYSTNLTIWNPLTNFVSSRSDTDIDELAPLPAERRFYRATAP